MIKSTDLMIGDLVYYSEPNQYLTRVDEILQTADNQPLYYIAGKRDPKDPIRVEDVNLFSCDILFPIQLTPEILKNTGFKHRVTEEDSDCFDYNEGDLSYYLIRTADGYMSYIDVTHSFTISGLIKYVHELQHILRLCGIEKEIVL